MSLSQERPSNPARRFLNIKGGAVVYYDRETQENLEVPTPLEFIVLDQLATVRGWSDQDESGYWSNEVRRVGEDPITVRTTSGIKEVGIWRDIKGKSSVAGARYHASVYIATKGRDGLEINNLSLKGAALNAWIEFTQKHNIRHVKVVLSGWKDAKKGTVSYKVPVFEAEEMLEGERDEAIVLDKELQAYFSEYFNYTPPEQEDLDETVVGLGEDLEAVDLDEIPFD